MDDDLQTLEALLGDSRHAYRQLRAPAARVVPVIKPKSRPFWYLTRVALAALLLFWLPPMVMSPSDPPIANRIAHHPSLKVPPHPRRPAIPQARSAPLRALRTPSLSLVRRSRTADLVATPTPRQRLGLGRRTAHGAG